MRPAWRDIREGGVISDVLTPRKGRGDLASQYNDYARMDPKLEMQGCHILASRFSVLSVGLIRTSTNPYRSCAALLDVSNPFSFVWLILVWFVWCWYGLVGFGLVAFGFFFVSFGLVWLSLVW